MFTGLLMVVCGVILVSIGATATGTLSHDATRAVSGHYSGTDLWCIIGGSVAIVAGLYGCIRGRRV